MIPVTIRQAWKGTADCAKCAMREMALFADLNEDDFSQIHTPIDDISYHADYRIHAERQKGEFVMTLRRGMVKLVRTTPDGRERIVRVLRQGDVIGLEALALGQYGSEAVALTDVMVCRIPISIIKSLSLNSPRIHTRLTEKWSVALQNADDWLADLNFGSAYRRVAQLFLKMRHFDRNELSTVFSREDMGAMLDLKLETVSRTISKMVADGLIRPVDKSGRIYEIIDANTLNNAI
jgi:CRP-like cAMP-binding protein